MHDENIDDVIDRLPPHLRRQVLDKAWPDEPSPEPIEPLEVPPSPPAWPLAGALLIGAVLALIGLVLCATVVLLPIGLPLLLLSGAPLAQEIKRRNRAYVEWEDRSGS